MCAWLARSWSTGNANRGQLRRSLGEACAFATHRQEPKLWAYDKSTGKFFETRRRINGEHQEVWGVWHGCCSPAVRKPG
jgi:hypothetical protein